jgi:hypothetical protein
LRTFSGGSTASFGVLAHATLSIMRAKGGGAFPPSLFVVPAELRHLYSAYIFQGAILFREQVVPTRGQQKEKEHPLEKVVPAPLHRGLTARSIS